jgi:xanthine dehydrogenase iron-sulfur cluster and FAD-binding subunit A
MSLFSSLLNADKDKRRPEPKDGFSKITVSEAERAVTNNLCRCTGYRSIVDTSKSFATDVDLEDLGLNIFWKKRSDASVDKLPHYSIGSVCTFPDFLKSEIQSLLNINNNSHTDISKGWYRPESIEELYKLLDSDVFNKGNVKVVVANTSSGVYKDQDLYDKYIDLKGIPDLWAIKRSKEGIEIGSAVTITRVIELLKEEKDSSLVFNKLVDHMNKVASQFVRNIASIGGNLILAQRNQFESDIATILLAAGAIVHIQEPSKRSSLMMEEFLDRPPCDDKTILLSIFIPSWASSSNLWFDTYRAAPRPLGNAVSFVNAGFLALTSTDNTSGDTVLDYIQLAFGAYGTEHAIRARNVEEYLKGKIVSPAIILEAIRLLREAIIPKEGTTHPAYRVSSAVGFLFRFLSAMGSNPAELSLTSQQDVEITKEYSPVGLPIKKVGAELQASGMFLISKALIYVCLLVVLTLIYDLRACPLRTVNILNFVPDHSGTFFRVVSGS